MECHQSNNTCYKIIDEKTFHNANVKSSSDQTFRVDNSTLIASIISVSLCGAAAR